MTQFGNEMQACHKRFRPEHLRILEHPEINQLTLDCSNQSAGTLIAFSPSAAKSCCALFLFVA